MPKLAVTNPGQSRCLVWNGRPFNRDADIISDPHGIDEIHFREHNQKFFSTLADCKF